MNTECVLLSSRSQSIIMVFHTSTLSPLTSLHAPYLLTPPAQMDKVSSLTSLAIPSPRGHDYTILLGQRSDGSVHAMRLSRPQNRSSQKKAAQLTSEMLKVIWDDDVTRISSRAGGNTEKSKAGTRFRIMDTRWAWLGEIFAFLHQTDSLDGRLLGDFLMVCRD